MEDYEIVELIAQGGYGIVLKALQKSTGQMVAIKQFRDSDSYTLAIAQREISVLKIMQGHPNIIKLLNSFQHNSKVFLVFELMHQTLLELMQNQPDGKLDREQVRLIVYQMVKALAYMHSKNAVHRDIKPENLMMSKLITTALSCVQNNSNGRISNMSDQQNNSGNTSRRVRGHSVDVKAGMKNEVNQINHDQSNMNQNLYNDQIYILKVCDLGQSKELFDKVDSNINNLTEYVSTRWYRAPELLVGSKSYDKSIDIWALGCIIPELISGNPLFPGKTNLETLAYIIRTFGNKMTESQVQRFYENPEFKQYGKIPVIKNIMSLDIRVPELTQQELDFVQKCLEFDPKLRPSAKQLLKHDYLKVEDHQILQSYLNQVPKCDQSDQQSNTDKSSQDENQQLTEKVSNVSESIMKQETPNNIIFETDQEEIAPINSNTNQSNNDSEVEQNVINDSNKSLNMSQYQKIQNKKPKKRPSSSGQKNSSSTQNDQKSANNQKLNGLNNVSNFNNNNNIAPNPSSSEEYYGQEAALNTETNQTDSLNHQNPVQEKQLPKPILFLRKQKEAREQTKNNDTKLSEQKAFYDKAMMESAGINDIPFEMAQDVANLQIVNQQSQELIQQQAINRFSEPHPPEYRITHGTAAKLARDKINFNNNQQIPQRKEPIGLLNSQQKQKRLHDQVFSNEKPKRQSVDNNDQKPQQQVQQLYTIQKNKVLFANLKNNLPPGRSPPVKLNNPKLLIQNMNQIQKNHMNYQQQAYQQQALLQQTNMRQTPKFIDVKSNQIQQQISGHRNISQPPVQTHNNMMPQSLIQNDDQFKQTQASGFSRKFSNTNNYQDQQQHQQQQQQSKSPSQISAGNTYSEKHHQNQFLPKINKDKIFNAQQQQQQPQTIKLQNIINPGQKQNLLNTQKHVSNKLQLPQLTQINPPQQISAANLPNVIQQQMSSSNGGDYQQSFRKSLSIKSIQSQAVQSQNPNQQLIQNNNDGINNSDQQSYSGMFQSRIGTSYSKQQQQTQSQFNKQNQGGIRLPPSRGLMNIETRGQNFANNKNLTNNHNFMIHQTSQSHSPPHQKPSNTYNQQHQYQQDQQAQTFQINKHPKWYGGGTQGDRGQNKYTQSENKRLTKIYQATSSNERSPVGSQERVNHNFNGGSAVQTYFNSPVKPMSRSSMHHKQQQQQHQQQQRQSRENLQQQQYQDAAGALLTTQKLTLPRNLNKPPKR